MNSENAIAQPERFDPVEGHGRLIEAEHRARYALASQFVAGAEVLDAGSGTGYGSRMLADAGAGRVVALDVDDEAVARSAQALGNDGAAVRGDVSALPFDEQSFDIVVCFEVIEHVEQQDAALDEFRRVLRPDGLLVISSPNRGVYPAGNPHHVHEYTAGEFETALRARFPNVRLGRQHVRLGTTIVGDDASAAGSRMTADVQLLDERTAGDEVYTVAVAGAGQLPDAKVVAAMVSDFEVRWWQEQVEVRDRQVEVRDREVEVRDRQIEEARIEHLRQAKEARTVLAERETEIADLRSALVGLETVQSSLHEQQTRIDELIAEMRSLSQELAEKKMIERHLQGVMEGMKDSVSWRATSPIRGAKRLAANRRR